MIEDGNELEAIILKKCLHDIDVGDYTSLFQYDIVAWDGMLPTTLVALIDVSLSTCSICDRIYVNEEYGCCKE